jgi:guanylate kinase
VGAPGQLFVVAAPSGTGKTSVCRSVLALDPRIAFSVSHTTRPMRDGETPGVDYHFVDEREFRRLAESGAFLEYAEYGGRLYGTSWRAIEGPLADGRDVLLDIEIQGAAQVKRRRPEAHLVFLLPPSLRDLETRLRARGTDAPAAIERRLAIARQELAAFELFDYFVVNDRLETAVAAVLEIVREARRGAALAARARFSIAAARARAPELFAELAMEAREGVG